MEKAKQLLDSGNDEGNSRPPVRHKQSNAPDASLHCLVTCLLSAQKTLLVFLTQRASLIECLNSLRR
jgi:hypothetical protein